MFPLPGARWRKSGVSFALALVLNATFTHGEDPPVGSTAPVVLADESSGYFEVEKEFYSFREDAGAIEIKILRKGGSFGAVTLVCRGHDVFPGSTYGGVAHHGSDYVLDSSTLTFEQGQTEQTATLRILKDGIVEGLERFVFEVRRFSSGTVLTKAELVILDIDDPGSLVTSFAPNIVNGYLRLLHVERNGNVIVGDTLRGTQFTRVDLNGDPSPVIADPQLDFGIKAVAALPDGRLYIAGPFKSIHGVPRPGVALIKTDGTLDASFAPTVGPYGSAEAAAVQSDGSLIVIGRQYMARFRPDGIFDPAYAPAVRAIGTRLLIDSKDRAYYESIGSVVRLLPNGTVDPSFATTFVRSPFSTTVDIVFDEEERVIICGSGVVQVNGVSRKHLARLTETGELEPSLKISDTQWYDPTAIVVQPDGRILLATQPTNVTSAGVVRLLPDGSADPSFKLTTSGVINSMKRGANSDLVVAGNFTMIDGVAQRFLARVLLGPDLARIRFSEGLTATVEETAEYATVTVKRSGPADKVTTVSFGTESSSAIAGEDFESVAGRLTFLPGETEKQVLIPLIDDEGYERGEVFRLKLSNSNGALLVGADSTLLITIVSDDPRKPGVLAFSASAVDVAEESGMVTLRVDRTGGADEEVRVSYRTRGRTARDEVDYLATSGELVFADGVTTQMITVPLVDDHFSERLESFRVLLYESSGGATLGTVTECGVSIADADTDTVESFRGNYGGSIASAAGFKGTVSLKIGPTGAASGSVVWLGRKLPISGSFDESGHLVIDLLLPRGGTARLGFTMGALDFERQITGKLETGGEAYPLNVGREVYHARHSPFPGAGRYTALYSPLVVEDGALGGHGYAVIRIGRSGRARIVGALADGTRFSHSALAGEDGRFPFLVRLYEGRGMLAGELEIAPSQLLARVGGSATWTRPNGRGLRAITSQLEISGSRYTGDPAVSWSQGAKLVLSKPGTTPIMRDILGLKNGRFHFATGGEALSLRLNEETGVFTGNLRASPSAESWKIHGVLLQDEQTGAGYFLSPAGNGGVWIGVP